MGPEIGFLFIEFSQQLQILTAGFPEGQIIGEPTQFVSKSRPMVGKAHSPSEQRIDEPGMSTPGHGPEKDQKRVYADIWNKMRSK